MAETNHDHGERIQTEDEALQAMRDEVQGSVARPRVAGPDRLSHVLCRQIADDP
jgi:hypothetical protein